MPWRSMENDEDFHEMEEPVPCPGCSHWVELQTTRPCSECKELFCSLCLRHGLCAGCRPADTARRRSQGATDGWAIRRAKEQAG